MPLWLEINIMAKRKRVTDQATINRRLSEGRGQGRLADYRPWLHIQDVPSQGLATRIKGWKTGRTHHFLSQLECHYFYLLEWSHLVVDIREQYPLNLEETLAIAESLGIRHPTTPGSKEPAVMMTDFLITLQRGVSTLECARTVKYSKDLASERVAEKFEIERLYWKERSIDWGIVTELDIERIVIKNVELMHSYLDASYLAPLDADSIHRIEDFLTPKVRESHRPLRDLAEESDRAFNLQAGTSLSVVRHLLASRRWRVDIGVPIQPGAPLVLLADAASLAVQIA